MIRVLPWLLLAVFTFSQTSFAQDDDDLAPLAPKKPKPAKPKPAVAKPAPKPKPTAKPVAKPLEDDDDLAPLAVARADVTVKLSQGLTNAVLSIDGKDVGPLPQGPQSLTAGEHQLKVRRAGYADFVKKVTVVGGKALELDAKLTAISAVVSVTSDVPDAQVLINGRLVGTAPITDLEVPAGPAELVVRKLGFSEDKQRLTLVAGKDYPVIVKFKPATTTVVAASDRPAETRLTPVDDTPLVTGPEVTTTAEEKPIYAQWYFWAGVAAVAVGAAVVTGVVVNNNATKQPTRLTEGEVCTTNMGRCDICVGFQCSMAGLPSGVLNF